METIKQEVETQLINIKTEMSETINSKQNEAINVINSVREYVVTLGGCNLCNNLLNDDMTLNELTIIKPNKEDKTFNKIDYLICTCSFIKLLSVVDCNSLNNITSMSYNPYHTSIYSKLFLDTCYRHFITINKNNEITYDNSLFSNAIKNINRINRINVLESNYPIEELKDLYENNSRHNYISLDFRRFNMISTTNITNRNIYYIYQYLLYGKENKCIKLYKEDDFTQNKRSRLM